MVKISGVSCFVLILLYAETRPRDVTQKSLRQAIGVVPQDSVLFNSSIAYNIG